MSEWLEAGPVAIATAIDVLEDQQNRAEGKQIFAKG
jgi:hypothetical protein